MTRPLKIDHALKALPEVDDLVHLREALIGAARDDQEQAWSGSEAYATLDTRLADPAALEERIAALAERARERVEAVLRHSVRSLRALEAGDPAAAARALADAGEVEEDAGRLDAAEAFYRQALAVGRRPRDRSAEGLALRRLARVARERGRLDEALRLYLGAFEVASALRDAEGAVVACQGAGNVYVDQGMWESAREWYLRGVDLLGGGPPSRALWQLQANLAVVARRTGDLDASAAWLDAAEAAVRELGDPAAGMPLENGRARLLEARGDFAAAEAAYRRSLEGGGTPSHRGAVLSSLADCLVRAGRPRQAQAAARELERLAVVHGLTPLLPHAYRTLGAAARARGDAEGFVFFEQALELCAAPGTPPIERASTQHEYALMEADGGRTESAAARLEEALAIYRRLGARPEIERAERDLAAVRAAMDGNVESGGAAGPAGRSMDSKDGED